MVLLAPTGEGAFGFTLAVSVFRKGICA